MNDETQMIQGEEAVRLMRKARLAAAERLLDPPVFFSDACIEATKRKLRYRYASPEERLKMDQEDLKARLKRDQQRRREPRPNLGPSLQIQVIKERAREKRKRRLKRKIKQQLWKKWKGRRKITAEIKLPIASSAGETHDPKS